MRIGCAQQLLEDPQLLTQGWRSLLLRKRLECKQASIQRLLTITEGSWEHAFYISLARNFGFHTNSLPFEELAIATPLSAIRKHRDSLFQVTAILLGQSGLPIQDENMAREYEFLRTKFSLTPIDAGLWKMGRIRPQNSPERRIRQFAYLLHSSEFLFSRILELPDIRSLAALFAQEGMSRASIDILLINTVLPYRFAYNPQNLPAIMQMMEQIAPENNSIVRQWRMLGQTVRNAADSQALLHLYQNYCQHHECINCEVGYQIFFADHTPRL
jgi:hypothetical protein